MGKVRYEYILCYDVSDSKKRREIFEFLKDHGMFPIQKSVFWGTINIAEKRAIERKIENIRLAQEDRVLFFSVDIFKDKRVYMKGHDVEEFVEKRFGIL